MEEKQISGLTNVRSIIQHPNNKKIVDQIVMKMGRLLAKKQNLSDQSPQLVYDGRIWLGNYIFASDIAFLNNNNITTIFSCLQLAPSMIVDGVTYKRFPLKGILSIIQMDKTTVLRMQLYSSANKSIKLKEIFMCIGKNEMTQFFRNIKVSCISVGLYHEKITTQL